MNLRGNAFVKKDGEKVPLLGVYHAKTWDTQKKRTEEDFKESGIQRVVVATCPLGMGINFQNLEYVVHFGPAKTVTEIIQQSDRAGRSGQQAFSIVYATNRQLSQCDKDVKGVVKSESCIALYQHFQEAPTSKEPGHFCCTVCRKNCTRDGDGCAMGDIHHLLPPQDMMQSSSHTTRKMNEMDKDDLRLPLNKLKDNYSLGVVSFFQGETCHGFSQSLVNDIVDHAEYISSGKYLTDNLAIYSSIHAIGVLEIFQELVEDIDDVKHEMDELHSLTCFKLLKQIGLKFLKALVTPARLKIKNLIKKILCNKKNCLSLMFNYLFGTAMSTTFVKVTVPVNIADEKL